MDPQYLQSLYDMGLGEKQALAYLALLELGRGSAASVAAKSGLKSPTAYVILKELIERGLVRKVPKAKKQLFVAESPDVVLSLFEERVAGFRAVVPALDALAKGNQNGGKTRTLFFEGLSGMRKAYEYRQADLKNIEYLAYFASAEEISKGLEAVLLEWSAAMARNDVISRAIVPNHPTLAMWREKDEEFKRKVRIVPTDVYSAKSAIEIFPDFVRISLFRELQCTIIEDAEFAAAQRQIFEVVWRSVEST